MVSRAAAAAVTGGCKAGSVGVQAVGEWLVGNGGADRSVRGGNDSYPLEGGAGAGGGTAAYSDTE